MTEDKPRCDENCALYSNPGNWLQWFKCDGITARQKSKCQNTKGYKEKVNGNRTRNTRRV